MSRQPPPNNDEQFASDLEAIENAMNNMMQGAFSMVFKELLGSDNNGIFEQFPHTTTTTTIIDGNNISTHREGNHIIEDEFGGSDFKRLANRSKQNRGLIPATPTTTTEGSPRDVTTTTPTIQQQSGESILPGLIAAAAGSIFNRMIQPEIMSKRDAGDIVAHQQKEVRQLIFEIRLHELILLNLLGRIMILVVVMMEEVGLSHLRLKELFIMRTVLKKQSLPKSRMV